MYRTKTFREIYFISGEIVTIFTRDNCYNYKNTLKPDIWECGAVTLKNGRVDFGQLAPRGAVIEAYEQLGYTKV